MTLNQSQGHHVLQGQRIPKTQRVRLPLACAIALAALLPLGLVQAAPAQTQAQPQTQPQPAAAGTLERVRNAGKLVLGYYADKQPLSYRDTSGQPAGYAVRLCYHVAEAVKAQLQSSALTVEWVAVTPATSLQDVQEGRIDLLCTADLITLTQREYVSFSAPIFLDGLAAVVNTSAPAEFQRILENRPEPYKPIWRGTVPAVAQHRTLSAVAGTPAVDWLTQRVSTLNLIATISTEESYAAGVAKVAKGKSDVLLGDRAQLLALVKQSPDAKSLKVLSRHFTYQPLALTLPRNDDDFRLTVDRALSDYLASPKFGELYDGTFGKADADTVEFFRGMPR